MTNAIIADLKNDVLVLSANGRIDTSNAQSCDQIIAEALKQYPGKEVILDCENLEYISSAGLRVVLRLRKQTAQMKVTNVRTEVYEVFEMTGFTEMMTIEKAYRRFSVEGCEVIGHGANGDVYRLNADTIIKLYHNPDSLADIHRERELARKAFVLGIPSAIPYDVVKIGDSYGSVFELLDAKSICGLLRENPERLDELADMTADLLHKLHDTEVEIGVVPDTKAATLGWVDFLEPHLPQPEWQKLKQLVSDVPFSKHLIHGDYHIKNVMVQSGEALLIDMDTLAQGNAIFEFGSIYISYIGFPSEQDGDYSSYFGLSFETLRRFWKKMLQLYFATEDEATLREYENRAALVGSVRLLRRAIRRTGDDEKEKKIQIHTERILSLIHEVDSLAI